MLIRLGKNTGAESKTLSGKDVAQIPIKQKKINGGGYKLQDHTETLWLASEHQGRQGKLLPFGWALVEISPEGDNPALQHWCEQNSNHLAAIRRVHDDLAERKKAAAERAAKQAEEARLAREAAERRQAELAAMNPAERLAAEWLERLQGFVYEARNQEAHNAFYQSLLTALTQAVETLTAAEQKTLAEKLSFRTMQEKKSVLFEGKREKEIKNVLRRLRGEVP